MTLGHRKDNWPNFFGPKRRSSVSTLIKSRAADSLQEIALPASRGIQRTLFRGRTKCVSLLHLNLRWILSFKGETEGQPLK